MAALLAGAGDRLLRQPRPPRGGEAAAAGEPTLLHDGGARIAGLRCWGSPWTPGDGSWAFTGPETRLARAFARIPAGLGVLVTHGTPRGVLDGGGRGSTALAARPAAAPPRLHVFGHLHGDGGRIHARAAADGGTRSVNAAAADDRHQPVRGVTVVELRAGHAAQGSAGVIRRTLGK